MDTHEVWPSMRTASELVPGVCNSLARQAGSRSVLFHPIGRAEPVIEYRRGTRAECSTANGLCAAADHEQLTGYCDEVEPRVLAYDCGVCWSST